MIEVISLKEYQRYGDISENDLIKINKFLQKNKLGFAFKITPHTIETSSWIGVLKHKNIQLEVLPKLLSSSKYDNKLTLSNLLFMLSYTHNLNIKTTNMASLNKSTNPFLEILIREYAISLLEGLKKLDKIIPGVNNDETLLYGPEIKFFSNEIETDNQFKLKSEDIYFIGDGAGKAGNIVVAAATGLVAARDILEKEK